MQATITFLIGIVILIVLLEMLASKIRVAYPILLVLAGLLISTIPYVPQLKLNPEWVFFVFLPPLLFEASWSVSFGQMKRWWRIIGSFSFLVVFFTATSVALLANYFIPGFSLALGFLLGGIVSPPDAVSAGAILKFVKVPKSIQTLLEGESLFNDASSLIIFRFAMVAVATGQFIWSDALMSFGWMVLGGAAIGVTLGWLFVKAHQRLPTDAVSDIAFTLIEPYILYWVAEQLHSSGVMAVVSGGLFLSTRRLQFLTSESRVRGYSVWESFVFILNGIVFFIIGLDLPEIVNELQKENIPLSTGIYYGVMVTVFIIVIRIIASYAALFSTILFRRSILPKDFSLKRSLRTPIVMGWTGMRGVVSLAAALSIPVYLSDGTKFPNRELILFISFVVIILTLFVQGLTLPFLLRNMKLYQFITELPDDDMAFENLKKQLWQHSIDYLQQHHQEHINGNVFVAAKLAHFQQKLETLEDDELNPQSKKIYLELLGVQRQYLVDMNKQSTVDEELIRKMLYLVDLDEERIKSI